MDGHGVAKRRGRSASVGSEATLIAAMQALCAVGGTSPRSVRTGPLHHLELGDGPPIVLVHGAGGGAANWYRMFGPLSQGHRVLAPDLPGFGLSDVIPLAPPLGVQSAGVLIDWLDALGLERVSLVGTSFGGLAALRLAQLRPERVDRLVLIDTAGAGPQLSGLVHATRIPLLATLLMRPSRRGTRTLLRSLLLTRRIPSPEEDALVEYLYQSARRGGAAFMVQALRRFATFAGQRELPTTSELAQVRTPTLVVWGALDRFFPATQAQQLAGALPDARAVVIEDAGHSPNWEQPDRLATELKEFLC